VELEEIEAVLSRHPSIRQCAVIPVLSRDQRERSLLACFTTIDGHTPTPDQLRLHLSRHLPSHMIPASFMMLAQMPLTASGKVDYCSLPPSDSQPLYSTSDFAEPSTSIEKRLAALWREVLRIPRLDITADFFRVGGDSLSAMILIGMIDREFGQELSLGDLVHAPTIARLASILEKGRSTPSRDDVIPFRPIGTLTPIFGVSSMNDDILCFRHLAPQLGDDRPFFAIANPIGTELRTVEELASTFCDRIHDIRPHGPYILAGFCFGGVVAF
jgi:acyl carrier protein